MEPKREPKTNKKPLKNQSKKKLRFKLFFVCSFFIILLLFLIFCSFWCPSWRVGPGLARGRKERHMTNGCEHLLLFGFIFSNWNQKCYQNAPNLYQNEAKMLPKTDKMVPRSFQKPIRTPRSSFDGRKAPKIDQNLSQWWQNGSTMF